MAHIKSVAPQSFKPQVDDIEKRINILFDHLNNDDLLEPETVEQMVTISECVRDKQWERAQSLFSEMASGGKEKSEGGLWMVSSLPYPYIDVEQLLIRVADWSQEIHSYRQGYETIEKCLEVVLCNQASERCVALTGRLSLYDSLTITSRLSTYSDLATSSL